MKAKSLPDMFFKTAEKYGDKVALMYKEGGTFLPITYSEFKTRVEKVAAGLLALGIEKDDKVAIISANRPEWAISDFAIMAAGAVTVPVYPTITAKQIEHILNNSEAKAVIVADETNLEKLLHVYNDLKFVKFIITLFPGEKEVVKVAMEYHELEQKGEEYLKEHPHSIKDIVEKLEVEELATIIYTSGTTGVPKGAMLTHNNFLSNVTAAKSVIAITHKDTTLSFLPLSHVFERMAGHFCPISEGATIAYAESVEKVSDNLKEVHPTIVTAIPRFFEKMYAKVIDTINQSPDLKKKLFFSCIDCAKSYITAKEEGKLAIRLKLKKAPCNLLVFKKLRKKLGGKLRFFVSGGAPLPGEIGEFFNCAGVIIIEGYGLTETSPVITANKLEKYKFGTVGPLLPGIEVKIAEDGEILTRGPHVMKGYYKAPEETAKSIDSEGWFYTGDIGCFDDDGYLTITDRKKNIIVTSVGKNIAPQPIENSLSMSRYINQVIMVGNKRKYISALIIPENSNLEDYAKIYDIPYKDMEELINHPKVHELYESEINRLLSDFSDFEHIKKFKLMNGEFSIENGELTPTLKIKRKYVEEKYSHIIDELYTE